MKHTLTLLLAVVASLHLGAQLNAELVGNLDYDVDVNDVWGYVAPDGTEYALLGLYDGVAVISLADPANPTEVGRTKQQNSNWRDMKTYGEYAYVVADEGDAGLTVIDLRNLPDSISYTTQQYTVPGFDRAFVRAHNLYVDNSRGLIFTAGGDRNLNDGGILVFDAAANPLAPPLVAAGPATYSHDVYVQDDRMYASEIYRGELAVYDVSNLAAITELGRTRTPFTFTHNAWTTGDSRTVFTTDERANASVAAFDLSDLNDIRLLDEYRPLSSLDTRTIPHNVHVIDDFLAISYYTDGLRVVDATDPANLIEVANYDTWPGADGGFNGAWGAFPFLPSGLTLVSDRATGLYVIDVNYVRAARLAGTVVNELTEEPVNGARITILATYPNDGRTDASGYFATGTVLSDTVGVQQDVQLVRISAPGYFDDTISVRLVSGLEMQEEGIELMPQVLAQTTVTLRDRETEAPIPAGHLLIQRDSLQFQGITDSLGELNLIAVPNRSYRATATAWGYLPTVIERVEAVQLRDSVIYLDRGYADDFVSDLGWRVEGDATAGQWELSATNSVGGDPFGGAYLTGGAQGDTDSMDVDSGRTVLVSPYFSLGEYREDATLSFTYYLSNRGPFDPGDALRVEVVGPDGTALLGSYSDTGGEWVRDSFTLDGRIAFSDSLRLQVTAFDLGGDNLVRAGFDAFRIRGTLLSTPVAERRQVDYELAVYPNPSTTRFTLSLADTKFREVVLDVYDVRGSRVERRSVTSQQQTVTFGEQLPRGVYVARLTEHGRVVGVLKVVKQ